MRDVLTVFGPCFIGNMPCDIANAIYVLSELHKIFDRFCPTLVQLSL